MSKADNPVYTDMTGDSPAFVMSPAVVTSAPAAKNTRVTGKMYYVMS